MGMNTPSLLLTVALVSVASTSTAAPTHRCSDPCLQAARGAYREQANAFPCRDAAVQAAGPSPEIVPRRSERLGIFCAF